MKKPGVDKWRNNWWVLIKICWIYTRSSCWWPHRLMNNWFGIARKNKQSRVSYLEQPCVSLNDHKSHPSKCMFAWKLILRTGATRQSSCIFLIRSIAASALGSTDTGFLSWWQPSMPACICLSATDIWSSSTSFFRDLPRPCLWASATVTCNFSSDDTAEKRTWKFLSLASWSAISCSLASRSEGVGSLRAFFGVARLSDACRFFSEARFFLSSARFTSSSKVVQADPDGTAIFWPRLETTLWFLWCLLTQALQLGCIHLWVVQQNSNISLVAALPKMENHMHVHPHLPVKSFSFPLAAGGKTMTPAMEVKNSMNLERESRPAGDPSYGLCQQCSRRKVACRAIWSGAVRRAGISWCMFSSIIRAASTQPTVYSFSAWPQWCTSELCTLPGAACIQASALTNLSCPPSSADRVDATAAPDNVLLERELHIGNGCSRGTWHHKLLAISPRQLRGPSCAHWAASLSWVSCKIAFTLKKDSLVHTKTSW